MELKDIIQLFMSNKKTYGIITLIALVFGIIVVISIPKQYTAKVMLSPETNNDMSKLGGLGSIASSMGLNMNNSNTDAIGPQFYPNVVSSTSFIVGLFDIKIKSDDGKFVKDAFRHELAFVVGDVLFTGCAHNGILNILESIQEPIRLSIGGFHLLDSHLSEHYETDEQLRDISSELARRYPDMDFYTGHCTGEHCYGVLSEKKGLQLHQFHCGDEIGIG